MIPEDLVLATTESFGGHEYGSASPHALSVISHLHRKAPPLYSHRQHFLPSTVQIISRMKIPLCVSALLTCAIAAPSSPAETSRTFKLKSLALSPSNSFFSNLYLEPYHIYPGANYAVLSPKTSTNLGIIGYLNGTAEDFANESTDLLFSFDPAPYGFIVDSVNATYNPILINAGNGTTGIFINQGVIKYHNPMSGGFYGK